MLNFFKNKQIIISLAGVLVLSLFFWFAGPYIEFAGKAPLGSILARVLVIFILFVLWGLYLWRMQVRARKNSQAIADNLASGRISEDEQAAGQEVSGLRSRFEQALRQLRKTGGGKRRGSQYLYDMPWYIIIGPSGTGKTTLLQNSELKFPLADEFGPGAIRGEGGTRDCDWWFSEEAVMLDTAGRYTTQESHTTVDKMAWEGFLGLLKQYRRRRPINGVLIAISVTELTGQTEDQRNIHVRAINKRLQELDRHLNVRFPVYVLFTKCDLLAGFTEFFEPLDKKNRGQVWGMTFPMESAQPGRGVVELFSEEFDLLMQHLNERILQRVHEERLQKRCLVYNFPQQIHSLKPILDEFLLALFRPSRFQPAPFLRGIYFTSGTQEGAPLDRIMSAAANTFGLDQQSLAPHRGHGKSYFVNSLFREVIFREADIVGLDKRYERQQMLKQYGAVLAVFMVTAWFAWAWTGSFNENNAFISNINEHVGTHREEAGKLDKEIKRADFVAILPALNSLRDAVGIYAQHRPPESPLSPPVDASLSPPLRMQWGLYQGDVADPAAQSAYLRALNTLFLRHIAKHLADRLNTEQDEVVLYQALKAYLMIKTKYIDYLKKEADFFKQWMAGEWADIYALKEADHSSLQGHLQALLQNHDVIKPIEPDEINDGQLIKGVRIDLSRTPLFLQFYRQIKEEAVNRGLAKLDMEEKLRHSGGSGIFVSRDKKTLRGGIDGLYTRDGYCNFFRNESKRIVKEGVAESWVLANKKRDNKLKEALGNEQSFNRLYKEVQQEYFTDYVKYWRALLTDLRIIQIRDLEQAANILRAISSAIMNSPLSKLLEDVQEHTALACESALPGAEKAGKVVGVAAALSGKVRQIKQRADRVGKAAARTDGKAPPSAAVAREFALLNQLIEEEQNAKGRRGGRLRALLGRFAELRKTVDLAIDSPADVALGRNNIFDQMDKEAEKFPPTLQRWVKDLNRKIRLLVMNSKGSDLNEVWGAQVLSGYNAYIHSHYPLFKSSGASTPLQDFTDFFGAGGAVERFFDEHLKQNVDMRKWRWKRNPLKLKSKVLKLFQRADTIKKAFFISGNQASVGFTLVPDAESSPVIQRFTLNIGGQVSRFQHGPPKERHFQWPFEGEEASIKFDFNGGRNHIVRKNGPWAWLRILNQARIRAKNATTFELRFSHNGADMIYELRADSTDNPFSSKARNALSAFRCPERLQ
ncbi:MAG: type VI secretion system membrane subunit TssM [Gammaproteobacteria bacterium]|nr:type VI secretion system membrane subunit TssM [Gammaproteobacteria bacterium]